MNTQILTFDMAEYYPLDEELILHDMAEGQIASFASQKAKLSNHCDDYAFLTSLPARNVYYGAADAAIYPFIYFPDNPLQALPRAREVLKFLAASCFESEHIHDLDVVTLPWSGYQPHSKNDEIHNDAEEQYLFVHSLDRMPEDELEDLEAFGMEDQQASRDYHQKLRNAVIDEQLYYVAVHSKACKEYQLSQYVILFAVGVSCLTGNLLGVVGHQVCHNLCD